MLKRTWLVELLLLVIITVPAILSLLSNGYFSMHDDQHIARLFLLDQGIKQGSLFPRWVGGLGFGYGYPLYNFYPPLIYYIGEIFHAFGFSYIWSIKLVFILGFVSGAVGIYLLLKKVTRNQTASLLGSTLYTYFFYHAVLVYVRGALAEFFSLAILPFVFLALHNVTNETNRTHTIVFGITFALLILTHPLIAFPALIFLVLSVLFYFLRSKNRVTLLQKVFLGGLLGLALSAFYWLPSMMERKFTLVDTILTSELANYKLHYIYPQQFMYSPWGYGGSGQGLADGMTFQLGKIYIAVVGGALLLSFLFLKRKKSKDELPIFYFFVFLLGLSLFMSTGLSSIVWDNVKFLWYLQFPWRFLTFTALFISVAGAYFIVFIDTLSKNAASKRGLLISAIIIITTITIYQRYFKPQKFIQTNDIQRTSFEEISWKVSGTSYEFVPKGVKTTKSQRGTTILDIKTNDVPKLPYQTVPYEIESIKVLIDKYSEKKFLVSAFRQTQFRLNTYNFPGWTAYIDGKKATIEDTNDLKLINVSVPGGVHELTFRFEDTNIRKIGNVISGLTIIALIILLLKKKLFI